MLAGTVSKIVLHHHSIAARIPLTAKKRDGKLEEKEEVQQKKKCIPEK